MVSYDQSFMKYIYYVIYGYLVYLITINETERANQGHWVSSEVYVINQPCCE